MKLPEKLLPSMQVTHLCIKLLVITLPVSFTTPLMNIENVLPLGITISTAITIDTTLARVLSSFMTTRIQNLQSVLRNTCSLAYQDGFCKWKVYLIHQIFPSVFQLLWCSLLLLLWLLRHLSISIMIPLPPRKL